MSLLMKADLVACLLGRLFALQRNRVSKVWRGYHTPSIKWRNNLTPEAQEDGLDDHNDEKTRHDNSRGI